MNQKDELIEGAVAGVISKWELAINIGSDQGVRRGMKFQVTANRPTKITDPFTDEVLGSILRDKVQVRATRVEPKFSVCRTYEAYRTAGSSVKIGDRVAQILQ